MNRPSFHNGGDIASNQAFKLIRSIGFEFECPDFVKDFLTQIPKKEYVTW
jgi:hypothetical protein